MRELFMITDCSPCCSFDLFASRKDYNSCSSAVSFEMCWLCGTEPLSPVQLAEQCLHQAINRDFAGAGKGLTNKQGFC